jgi:hypothetical protein
LFALALQLALSFAHVHSQDFAGVAGHGPVIVTAPTPPFGEDDGDGVGHDHCAICATMQILASSVLPPPPMVAAPIAAGRTLHVMALAQISAAASRRSFQARAPPQA